MAPFNGLNLTERLIDHTRAMAVSAVKSGKRVIILGCLPSNLPQGLTNNPLVECWFGDRGLPTKLPDTAGLVLHSRFVHHHDTERLRAYAYRRNIDFVNHPFTTGCLRKILEPLVPVPQPTRVAQAPPPVDLLAPMELRMTTQTAAPSNGAATPEIHAGRRMQTRPGLIKAFIRSQADLQKPVIEESKRLLVLARHTPGVEHTTLNSLQVAMYGLRKKGTTAKRKASPMAQLPVARNARRANAQGRRGKIVQSPRAEDSFVAMASDLKAGIDLLVERYMKLRAEQPVVETAKELRDRLSTFLAGLK